VAPRGSTVTGLLRQGHFLGSKLRALRKRNGLTLEELSSRCVQLDAGSAPSVSYLSMVETGKRIPSTDTLAVLAAVFGKEPGWFLDRTESLASEPRGSRAGIADPMPLEPAFLFSKDLLQLALPELLAQTGTSGRQFARLLVRVWQETRQNEFPDIERAAETVGRRRMPLSLDEVLGIVKETGLAIRWVDDERRGRADPVLRARYEAPGTVLINRNLRAHEARLKYTLAFFIGHRILHNGDGVVPPHSAAGPGFEEHGTTDASAAGAVAGMAPRDVLLAWRDFECSAFAGALLCPKQPFRQFLVRERHELAAVGKLGVTEAVMMRRMTSVSPYRHWHFFDGYAPGYLRAVYRGNGIPLPWGNMSLVPDPCPNWAVFRLLRDTPAARAAQLRPVSQLSVMRDGGTPRLYCCHSLRTRDAADVSHVLSVGIDLAPALEAQGLDAGRIIDVVDDSCERGGGTGSIPVEAAEAIRTVSHVLNIAWVARALEAEASIICPRSRSCPRSNPCSER
jgi:transcriptional regulator with XRE-family HTH domain